MIKVKPLIVGASIILVAANWWLFSKDKPSSPSGGSHLVTLSDYGFFPAELTINAGETVTFVSSRGEPFWPASDPHPAHTQHPDFDPQRALRPEEQWSFTFNEPGIFQYHDHLGSYYSTDNGVIRVLAEGEVIDESSLPLPAVVDQLVDCSQLEHKRKCWIDNLKFTMVREGLPATFELIDTMYRQEPGFASTCNDITHYVGGFAYRVFQNDKKAVVIPQSTICAFGFYHGFLEVWFHNSLKIEEAISFCQYVEDTLGADQPKVMDNCYHGIGHGAYHVYHISDWDNIAANLEPIFAICEQTENLYACLNGVFNAVNMDYHETRYKFLTKKENPFKYCDQLSRYQEECYKGFATSLIWSGEGSLATALPFIQEIADDTLAEAALTTVIQVAAFANVEQDDHQEVISLCRSVRQSLQSACLKAYIRGLMEQGGPSGDFSAAEAFCRQPLFSADERQNCINYVTEYGQEY